MTTAIEAKLARTGREAKLAGEAFREATARRREAIVEATEAGLSRRVIARAVELSPGRVQQILDET